MGAYPHSRDLRFCGFERGRSNSPDTSCRSVGSQISDLTTMQSAPARAAFSRAPVPPLRARAVKPLIAPDVGKRSANSTVLKYENFDSPGYLMTVPECVRKLMNMNMAISYLGSTLISWCIHTNARSRLVAYQAVGRHSIRGSPWLVVPVGTVIVMFVNSDGMKYSMMQVF